MGAKRLDRKLIVQIERWLSEWGTGQYGPKLTWEKLAIYTGFSRQSLCANARIAKAFRDAKVAIQRGAFGTTSRIPADDRLDGRIADLRQRISELERQAENWSALWERWRYNARQQGWDTSLLDRELPKPIHRRRPRH